MQPTDAHSRRLVPSDQSQPASEGLARKRLDRFTQRCWLVSKLRSRFGLHFEELGFFAPGHTGGPQTNINLNVNEVVRVPLCRSVVASSSPHPATVRSGGIYTEKTEKHHVFCAPLRDCVKMLFPEIFYSKADQRRYHRSSINEDKFIFSSCHVVRVPGIIYMHFSVLL